MFVVRPGGFAGRFSPSGVKAGGLGMLMIAVVICADLQFDLKPSSDFKFRLDRLVVREG